MKQTKRRLLSLLMAFAILCTMIPAAFAAEETVNWKIGDWEGGSLTDEHTGHMAAQTPQSQTDPTCTTAGTRTYKCTGCEAIRTDTADALGHNYIQTHDETNHWEECTRCKDIKNSEKHSFTYDHNADTHWMKCDCGYTTTPVNHNYILAGDTKCICGAEKVASLELRVSKDPTDNEITLEKGRQQRFVVLPAATFDGTAVSDANFTYAWALDGQSVASNNVGSYSLNTTYLPVGEHSVSCTVTASYAGQTKSETVTWKIKVVQTALQLNASKVTLTGWKDSFELKATVDLQGYSESDVTWTVSPRNYVNLDTTTGGSVVITPRQNGTVTITARVANYYEATCEVKVTGLSTDIVVKAAVLNTNTGYDLDDKDDEGGDSIIDQIRDEIKKISKYDDLDFVVFSSPVSVSGKGKLSASTTKTYYYDPSNSQNDLADVTFTPEKDYAGEVSFDFTAYGTGGGNASVYSGTVVFDVKKGVTTAGDNIYTSIKDKDVTLDVKDFETFWEDTYSKGTLEYVTFGSVSSTRGTLTDGDGEKLKTSSKCYADPSSKQIDLDEVTFEPKSGYTGTITIDFTARGTNNSKKDTDLPGTLVIVYTKGEPKAISYSVTNGKIVSLDGDDFLANYKDAIGTTAKTLQIKFLDVPTYGTLYYDYNERTEKGTELTTKNIGNYTFSTNSKASKALADVTYVPDSKGRSDTVKFACYDSSGTLCYYGEVTFGVTVKDVTVSLTSTSTGVTFNSADFFGASSDMLAVTYLTFGTPSNGTLYKNWTGVTGTQVSATDKFSYVASVTGYTSLSTVTYVPTAGYSGTVTIPFSAFTSSGTVINGTVSIKVTATSTVIFTDVPTTGSQSWAYPYITRLASAGVVGGITPTTYGPKQQVKWGEVLKMVLLGAGHPAQVEGTGANWAANYLTYAYQKGIISTTNIDLSRAITRVEMAELAAKALGLSAETSIKIGIIGPTDTTNGYVYALYNRGIVGGDSSSGKNLYNPNSTLLRDEMAKIVCGVMDSAK